MKKSLKIIEYRCPIDNKLLFKGLFFGVVEINCPKCKIIHQFESTESLKSIYEIINK